MPAFLVSLLQPFFPGVDLKRVRIHRGIPPEIRARSAVTNPAAITVGYTIYVQPGYMDITHPHGIRTLLHELRHIQQYAALGSSFTQEYSKGVRQYGYWRNPFELDAYVVEHRLANALGVA
ncbi:MAG: DUF4157 domain-containing protein [Nanopusillaceae archaeon]